MFYRKSLARSRAAYIRARPLEWLINEGGLNKRVDYPVNFFSNKYKPRSNISCAASGRDLQYCVLSGFGWNFLANTPNN